MTKTTKTEAREYNRNCLSAIAHLAAEMLDALEAGNAQVAEWCRADIAHLQAKMAYNNRAGR